MQLRDARSVLLQACEEAGLRGVHAPARQLALYAHGLRAMERGMAAWHREVRRRRHLKARVEARWRVNQVCAPWHRPPRPQPGGDPHRGARAHRRHPARRPYTPAPHPPDGQSADGQRTQMAMHTSCRPRVLLRPSICDAHLRRPSGLPTAPSACPPGVGPWAVVAARREDQRGEGRAAARVARACAPDDGSSLGGVVAGGGTARPAEEGRAVVVSRGEDGGMGGAAARGGACDAPRALPRVLGPTCTAAWAREARCAR